ncbi:DUF6228 family protein [Streptomyces sp. NPDC005262]|uniref:DUF6228 family protein n=1 Tax=Streptomyces sp. NPDC005262 TaxID=3364710 RepID=UPI00368F93F7
MTSLGADTNDKASVTIRCQDNTSVGVTFCDRFSSDADSVHYSVELRAPGLTARLNEAVAWIWDSDLTAFPSRVRMSTVDGRARVSAPRFLARRRRAA